MFIINAPDSIVRIRITEVPEEEFELSGLNVGDEAYGTLDEAVDALEAMVDEAIAENHDARAILYDCKLSLRTGNVDVVSTAGEVLRRV